MAHAIIRGKNGRRHEVDFGDGPIRVEIHASDETVEIVVESDAGHLPPGRHPMVLLSVPRHLFSEASGQAAKRAARAARRGTDA